MTDKIVDRVKKMLNLSKDAGATDQERETALRMAHALLVKHNLSMSSVNLDENVEVRQKDSFQVWAGTWARDVANSVGKLFFCKYYYMRFASGKEEHFFVGRQSNVITSMHMAEFLIRSINKEARRRYGDAANTNGRSFCVGAARMISNRVRTMLEEEVADSQGAGTGLMVINLRKSEVFENDAWLKAEDVKLVTAKARPTSVRTNAYNSGKEFGRKVSLNQQITGRTANYAQLN